LRNGRFEKGLDHWLPATDRRLAWHMDQTQVEIFFSQGLLGLIAWILIVFAAVRYLVAVFQRGDMAALALFSGLAGFLSVGLLGSTQDAALTGFVFYLVATSVVTSNRIQKRD
jgi:O-antigen ligase